jgi:hypothetical protein
VAVPAGASRHQIAVDDDVLILVDRAVGLRVADQVVVHRDLAPLDELGLRRDQPHAVADDPFDDVLLGKRALDEFGGRRALVDVLRVAQPVRHDARRHDDRGVAAQLLVTHVLEALAAFERVLVLVSGERDVLLAPEAGEKMQLHTVLWKPVLVIEDFLLVEVALDEDPDLLALQAH